MSKNELRSSGERVSVILRMARVNCNKMSIKVGCKSHDMRMTGRIVKVRSTKHEAIRRHHKDVTDGAGELKFCPISVARRSGGYIIIL